MQPIKSVLLGLCTLTTAYTTGFLSAAPLIPSRPDGTVTGLAIPLTVDPGFSGTNGVTVSPYVYIHSTTGSPWNSSANETAMSRAFGDNNWQDLRYETVNPAALFSQATQFIYMEGSDNNALEMQAFITANTDAMQSWVTGGGRLFLNAAPNEGAGMSFGFGVTLLYNYPITTTATANAAALLHPLMAGPFTPVGVSWTGTSFAHATISGTNVTTLITNAYNGSVVLGERQFGGGRVLFGGMTTDNFHSPQPEGSNLRANILVYTATFDPCSNCPPTIATQPASQTVAPGGSAAFVIGSSGTSPMSYFWLRDGEYVAGATNPSYSITGVQLSDSGAQFSCLVSNAFGSVLSSNAALTVLSFGNLDFQIGSLSTNNSGIIDHDSWTGDDRGGIAVSESQVFVTGDTSTARFNAGDLTGGGSLGGILDGLCSDLRTETVYALGNGTTPLTRYGGTVTTMIELNEATGAPTGVVLPLSQSVTMPSFSNGIFSGYGRVVVYNGTHVYDILLPSGIVTDLGTMIRPNWTFSESWSVWGVAEYFDGTFYLTYHESGTQRIVRSRVPDGLVTPVATFSDLSDMASFTVSPSRNRWYFHHEYASQFGGASETLGYADAQLFFVSTNPPTIVMQPISQTIPVGYNPTFAVRAIGSSPMTYSWLRNGDYITGATTSSYSTTNVQLSDSGTQFSCLLSNAFGTALSSNATMTVVVSPTDWFTEVFDGYGGYNDLAFRTLTFTPNGSVNFYEACEDLAATFPTDPTGGTHLALGSQSYAYLTLSNNISLYGQATNVIFLSSEGFVTLGSPDNSGEATLENHFSKPRISASFSHLDPTGYGGTVSLLQLSNRVAITFDNARDYESLVPNSFQIELFYDGRIRLTFLEIGTPTGLVGLSAGQGVSPYFVSSVLSAYGSCGPQPPVIGIQPANQTVTVGYGALFSVGVSGSAPMSYFWFRNGEYIPDATDATYGTDALQLSDSGAQFSCLVSNAFGTDLSSNAVLTVTLDPPVFEDGFYDQYLNEGEDLISTPSVMSETPMTFQWHHEGTNIVSATQQTLFLPNVSFADQGYYSLTASNAGGSATSVAFYLTLYQAGPSIISIPPSATALPGGYTTLTVEARGSRPLVFQWQKDSYNLTGQTNASLRIANATRNQGVYRVIVSNPLGVIASEDIPFTIETNLLLWASYYGGTYRGLFYDGSGHYDVDGVFVYSIEHSNSGFFSLRTMPNGAFSGYLQVDGDRIPFGGKFDAYGYVGFKVSRAGVGKEPLSVTLSLSSYDNSVAGTVVCDQWKRDISPDFSATLGGYRSLFTKTNPCPLNGRYTMNLDTVTDVPGYGHCCLKIGSNGDLTMSGNLADGTPIAQSVPVSYSGAWPLYVPLYPGRAKAGAGHNYKGSVIGWIYMNLDGFGTVSGTVNCRKGRNDKNAFYPNGFDFQTTAFGSSYLPPATNRSVLELSDATATFSQGNPETDISQAATLLDNRLNIVGIRNHTRIDFETGLVVGSFVTPDRSRTNHFKGVINQQFGGVFGQFLGTNSSGVFTVRSNF